MLLALARWYQTLFSVQSEGSSRLHVLYRKDREEYYREYFRHQREKGAEYLARFEPFARDWEGSRVLDFGCGGGGFSCHLGGRFRQVNGYDIDPAKIAHGMETLASLGMGNVRLTAYDGRRIPAEDASFDAVLCVDVMEHLADPEGALAEFHRLLRPGGRLYVSFGPPWRHPHGKHMWETVPGWWTHLLFPREVVMRLRGIDPATTWDQIGLNRMTVGRFNALMAGTALRRLHREYRMKRIFRPLQHVPWLREFFVAEVVAVYEKPDPAARSSTPAGGEEPGADAQGGQQGSASHEHQVA